MTQLVAVYCGSRVGNQSVFVETGYEFGKKLAQANLGLVYGGANVGVMGAVADGVLSQNGVAVGVIPEFLLNKEGFHTGLTRLHFTDTMHTRKAMMATYAGAFVALSGGMGTLEELAEIFTWRQLGIHQKPMILLNTNGYYDDFIRFLQNMADKEFMSQTDAKRLVVCETVDAVIDVLKVLAKPDADVDTSVF
nr:TIGR00730 family Rossman fold protein [Moraxella macacae]